MKGIINLVLLAGIGFLLGCSDDHPESGQLDIRFTHTVDGDPVIFNELTYENAAGNLYEITEAQWFISDVALISASGSSVRIDIGAPGYYIDTNLPETFHWSIPQAIDPGQYTGLRFTFGLKGENNIPGQFPDLPESNMVWPLAMGGPNGGYHYMKLNGFWLNPQNQRSPFNFHMGVGQIHGDNHQVIDFVQNWFEATLPVDLVIRENQKSSIELRMNIERWFKSPTVYDHNIYGGMIMMNQEAMNIIKLNGVDVFTAYVTPETK